MKPQTRIKNHLEEIDTIITRLEETKDSLDLECVYMRMDKTWINERAKLIKKYDPELGNNVLMAADTLGTVVDDCKQGIKAIEFRCKLLKKHAKELKGRLNEQHR
jgi:hypothetical protein